MEPVGSIRVCSPPVAVLSQTNPVHTLSTLQNCKSIYLNALKPFPRHSLSLFSYSSRHEIICCLVSLPQYLLTVKNFVSSCKIIKIFHCPGTASCLQQSCRVKHFCWSTDASSISFSSSSSSIWPSSTRKPICPPNLMVCRILKHCISSEWIVSRACPHLSSRHAIEYCVKALSSVRLVCSHS
jgi:hypothetical protein